MQNNSAWQASPCENIREIKACAFIAVSYADVWDNLQMWLTSHDLSLRWLLPPPCSLASVPSAAAPGAEGTWGPGALLSWCRLPLSASLTFAPNERVWVMWDLEYSQQPAVTPRSKPRCRPRGDHACLLFLNQTEPFLCLPSPHLPPGEGGLTGLGGRRGRSPAYALLSEAEGSDPLGTFWRSLCHVLPSVAEVTGGWRQWQAWAGGLPVPGRWLWSPCTDALYI